MNLAGSRGNRRRRRLCVSASIFDGVLANYSLAASNLLERMHGKKFAPDLDKNNPPEWNWWYLAFTKDEVKAFMDRVERSSNFWLGLEPNWDSVNSLALCIEDLEKDSDVYFVTNRQGVRAKRQTESWLKTYLPYNDEAIHPTVLLSSDKGAAAKALKLDAYVDDNLDNVKAVLRESPKTRVYLLNRNYNQGDAFIDVSHMAQVAPNARGVVYAGTERRHAIRINTLGEMLTCELVTQ